jgi:hypothetical protein
LINLDQKEKKQTSKQTKQKKRKKKPTLSPSATSFTFLLRTTLQTTALTATAKSTSTTTKLKFSYRSPVLTLDISVAHPLCKTALAQPDPLEYRANAKKTKYLNDEKRSNRDVYPFILSSLGSFHRTAIDKVLLKIARLAHSLDPTHSKNADMKRYGRLLIFALNRSNVSLMKKSTDVVHGRDSPFY